MSKQTLISHLRNIPDYPMKGVQFKDVTSWFMNPDDMDEIVDSLYEMYKDKGITKVCGVESRGFIVGAALAYKLNAGFIPIRKPGKLPYEKVSIEYKKEYGFDRIEMHKDSISTDDVVLIHDDLLATGGTLRASYELVKSFNPKNVIVNCIIELTN
ncbi:MAG: adenine phosphoribosyltransferase, partial [Bacteroidaceae bacterium]|nr:adenine phosphoribosyltransferase [Bacteroidaceae bacterium]